MWCSSCQQDVPGIASPSGVTAVGCARCGSALTIEHGSRSTIDFAEPGSATACGPTDCLAVEKVFESGAASARLEWERCEWDADLPHPDFALHDLAEPQTVKRYLPITSEPQAPLRETPSQWRSAGGESKTARGLNQRRMGWCFVAWGLGSVVPCGSWAMWFVAQNDSLWMFATLAAFMSLVVLLFGLVLTLHAQARQVEAIAGILQFFVREIRQLRADGAGVVKDAQPCASQYANDQRQSRAA